MNGDFFIIYNSKMNTELGIKAISRPNIPSSNLAYEEIEIEGRDGKLYRDKKFSDDIEINIDFNFKTHENLFNERLRKIKKWLRSDGDRKLIMSDDREYFYKVKIINIGNVERTLKKIGKFNVTFICEPFQYLESGNRFIELPDVLYNKFDISRPIYIFEGNGRVEFMVNGNSVLVDVNNEVKIDTEKMLCFNAAGKIENTYLSGDYEDLFLIEGENKFEIPGDFKVYIMPNWRCKA